MKRTFITIAFAFAVCSHSFAQYITGGSYFRPFTFSEMVTPWLIYKQARDNAIDQFNTYSEKAVECIDKGYYSYAVYYLKKCTDINERFQGNIYDRDELQKVLSLCEEKERKQKEMRERQSYK